MTPERFKDLYQEEASGSFPEDKLLKHRILLGDLWVERHWEENALHSTTLDQHLRNSVEIRACPQTSTTGFAQHFPGGLAPSCILPT
jgi:hypothetical protein